MQWNDVNEHELLALIEDELGPDEAAAVRARLRPEVIELVDRLREDRMALMEASAPDVPADLLDRLEPLLARPMLMSTPPGRLRRANQRQARRRQWFRLAAAAVLVLAGGAGLWALVSTLTPAPAPGPMVVDAEPETVDPIGRSTPVVPAAVPLDPVVSTPAEMLAGAPDERATATLDAGIEPAPIALVVMAADAADAERVVTRIARDLGDDLALVRNFNDAEFQTLLERKRVDVANAARTSPSDPIARMDTGRNGANPNGTFTRPGRIGSTIRIEDLDIPDSRLAGPADMGPSFADQLELSEAGATHTIAIRASQLSALLAALDEAFDGRTALDTLGAGTTTVEIDGEVRWVVKSPVVRASIKALTRDGDRVIELPIVIRRR